ncbi:glycosyltransferase family 2 protein [Salisediminibacterium selenitireducens]|uniref:Glycosyl transferase family 2 n=1 Tax=Bacillus selenitireducens (strain ATCC 700615 / DSM 15326 / MLS10) TaxID=439292 RepID=D6Y020_BACIE|nr:glycosyltransferase family 2 protein [Salisediminibacterium selenitireducens]ADI00522.1 glycosyl transferase family 2 [[Bacillus] selenitireducens MLS10]
MKNVSIIIPLYNKEPHIKRTILSVLNQTYKYYEVIVVDDGSTDRGPDIVKSIQDSRIQLIQQMNAGVSAARNKGVSHAKSDLVAFLDADDEWEPAFLETCIAMINKYPEAKMIGSSYFIINKDGEKKVPKFYNVPQKDGIIDNYFKAAIKRNPTWSSAVMIYKDTFNKVGGFPLGMRRGEDSFLWSKIALQYPIAFINTPLAIRHYDAINRASSNDSLIDDFPLFEYMDKELLDLDYKVKYYASELIYKKYLARASQCLRVGNKDQAKEFLLKAKETSEFKRIYWKLRLISYLPIKA